MKEFLKLIEDIVSKDLPLGWSDLKITKHDPENKTIYYKYDVPGEYRILLEVKNSFTLTDTTSRKIFVYDL